VLIGIVAAWLGTVVVGMGLLFAYSVTPGDAAQAPAQWPADASLARDPDRHTLVLVAHPKCSCTRASIAELSRLMTRLQGRVRGYVLFIKPEELGADWERTDLWRSASILDDVTVVADPDGVQAGLFGAKTSGQVYLFSPAGELQFEGGITPTRSHQGDSVGRQRIVSLVTEGRSDRDSSAVYGCSLDDDASDDFWFAGLRSAAGPTR
jgi:hypothetical protein